MFRKSLVSDGGYLKESSVFSNERSCICVFTKGDSPRDNGGLGVASQKRTPFPMRR